MNSLNTLPKRSSKKEVNDYIAYVKSRSDRERQTEKNHGMLYRRLCNKPFKPKKNSCLDK